MGQAQVSAWSPPFDTATVRASDSVREGIGSAPVAVIISSHDYRTVARANMHPIAEALAELGYSVCFLSVGFSPVSWLQHDRRLVLWSRANRAEQVGSIRCYLWRTPFHPVNPKVRGLTPLATSMYRLYPEYPSQFMDQTFRSAAVIVVESGLGILLISRARKLNAAARIVYLASDDLATLGAHPVLEAELKACGSMIDRVCIVSARMGGRFAWAKDKLMVVSHGFNPADFEGSAASPYDGGLNAVSVGSMLFDADFFNHAAEQFPNVTFHVIGSGSSAAFGSNVRLYAEMPYEKTIPYIKEATIGLAPYRIAPGSDYLCDTSMKLMQYDFLGLPAVCPHFAVGDSANRIGYAPGDSVSIRAAVAAALRRGRRMIACRHHTWREVTQRILGAGVSTQ